MRPPLPSDQAFLTDSPPAPLAGHRRALAGSLAAGVASQIVLVVSGVLAARILGPQDRGYLALLVLVPLILAQLGHMGVPLAVTYYLVQFKPHARSIVRELARLTLLQIAGSLLIQGVILFLLLRDEPHRVQSAGFVTFAYTPALFVQQFALSVLQGMRRFRAFNSLRFLPSLLYSLAIVTLFTFGSGDLLTIFALFVAATLLASAVTVIAAFRGYPDNPPETVSPPRSQMIRFGLKGFFGSVSPIDNLRVDQAVIALLLNPVALGLYVVAQSFTNLPRFIAQSIGMVAYPQVAAAPNAVAARHALWRYFAFSILICGSIIAVLEVGAGWLIRVFFGPDFSGGLNITRILLAGVFFLGARRVLADGARGAGLPGLGSLAEVTSWFSLAVGLALLVPPFGIEGVAIALAASWAISLVVALALLSGFSFGNIREGLVRSGLVVTIVVTLTGAALAAALLPLLVSIGLAIAVATALIAAHVRTRLARSFGTLAQVRFHSSRATALHPETVRPLGPSLPDLRLARFFYYAGLALIGELTLRPVGSFTLSDWFFFFALAAACASLIISRARVYIPLPSLLMVGVLIFTIGASLSTFDTDSVVGSNAILVRMIYITVVWFWLGTIVLQKFDHVRTAIILWVLSAAVCGSGAMVQLVAGNVIPGAEIHWGRLTGFTENVNDLGGVMSAAFVPAVMLLMSIAKRPSRILLAGLALSFVSAGLLVSGSVGSVIAASIAAAAWFGSHRARPSRLLALTAMALAAVVVYTTQISAQTPSSIERIMHLGSGSPDDPSLTLADRAATYRVAIKRVEQNPVVGVGLNRNTTAASEWVHNIFLGTWYTTGLFGLIGMILVFVASARASWSSIVSARSPDEHATGLALTCSFVAFLVFLMSEPALFIRYGWVSVALVCALRAIQTRESQTESSPEAVMHPLMDPVPS